jgi:hypothetical protein
MSTYPYKYVHAHTTLWSHLKDWVGLILRFIKSVTESASLSMETSPPNEKIISHKYNTYVKFRIWIWMYKVRFLMLLSLTWINDPACARWFWTGPRDTHIHLFEAPDDVADRGSSAARRAGTPPSSPGDVFLGSVWVSFSFSVYNLLFFKVALLPTVGGLTRPCLPRRDGQARLADDGR